jgi:hypothetical protein
MEAQLKDILSKLGTDPLALNLYLTLPSNSLPLLEPLYLLTDLTNLLTLGAFPNPLGMIANALAPALTSLVNLGYTDVKRMPDGTYIRTLDQAGDPTAFMSFPDVNWAQVPGDIFNLMVKGIQKEFFSGNPTVGTPNAITGIFKLLSTLLSGGNPLAAFGDIAGVINAVIGGMNPLAAASPLAAANALPSPTATTVTVSTESAAASSDAAPLILEDQGATKNDEETVTETPKEERPTGVRAAGPSAAPGKPISPVGTVLGGVTNTVGGVTGGVTNTVGGVVGGVTNTVGGVTGGVTNTVGGVVGGVTGAVGGLTGGLTGALGGLGGGGASSTGGTGGTSGTGGTGGG